MFFHSVLRERSAVQHSVLRNAALALYPLDEFGYEFEKIGYHTARGHVKNRSVPVLVYGYDNL